jgi:hypothetical protein
MIAFFTAFFTAFSGLDLTELLITSSFGFSVFAATFRVRFSCKTEEVTSDDVMSFISSVFTKLSPKGLLTLEVLFFLTFISSEPSLFAVVGNSLVSSLDFLIEALRGVSFGTFNLMSCGPSNSA